MLNEKMEGGMLRRNAILPNRAGKRKVAAALSAVGLLALTSCTTVSEQDHIASVEHMCSSCHGVKGQSVSPNFPHLAGQQKGYIINEIKIFQDHTRADPHAHTFMWGMAAGLDDATIETLATDYAAMVPAPGKPGDPADIAAGKQIYLNGVAEREVPACIKCHGSYAQGEKAYPRLAGQHQSYLEHQLEVFASNERAHKTMHQNAMNLTKDQIRQVAGYLASL
jgi:cytochrome c553